MKTIITFKICVTLLFCLVFFGALGQRKVWNDDKEANIKSDTSLVTIDGKDYRKLIVVTYEEINKKKLKENFIRQKQELRWAQEQRAELDERIAKMQAEMSQIKSLYSETAKKQNWKDNEIDASELIESENARREKLKADFLANPRRLK